MGVFSLFRVRLFLKNQIKTAIPITTIKAVTTPTVQMKKMVHFIVFLLVSEKNVWSFYVETLSFISVSYYKPKNGVMKLSDHWGCAFPT